MSGLADDALVREDFGEGLVPQVVVPRLCKALVLRVELRVIAVVALLKEAAPLLDAHIIVCANKTGSGGLLQRNQVQSTSPGSA
jgi:hypothetical protein